MDKCEINIKRKMDRVIHATDKKSRTFHFSISLPLDARRIYSDEIYDPGGAKRFNACRSLFLFLQRKGPAWNQVEHIPDETDLYGSRFTLV